LKTQLSDVGVKRILDDIENELKLFYQFEAIRFIDEHYEGAWSKAMDRWELVCNQAYQTGNYDLMKLEGEIYRQQILYLIQVFKQRKRGNDVEKFLDGGGQFDLGV
jgi:hypothetical protein